MSDAKRFYQEVTVEQQGDGWAILLDDRSIKAPDGAKIIAPTKALADAIRAEWDAVVEQINWEALPYTRQLGSALMVNEADRTAMVDECTNYAQTDLLCYRAEDAQLQQQQAEWWDPVLEWVKQHYDAPFVCVQGVMPVEQPVASVQAIADAVNALPQEAAPSFSQLVALLGSVLLALTLWEKYKSVDEIIALSQLDEQWQAEKWGEDEEAAKARAAKSAQIGVIHDYLLMLG